MVKNPRPTAPLLALFAAFLLGLGGKTLLPLCAEAFAPLPQEAPSSLMEAELGGREAQLLVQGSWELALLSKLSLAIPPEGGLRLAEAQPFLFQQTPDLLISFLLFDRWFVEARVSSDASQVRYAAGYRGGPNETLKELRLGNSGISFPLLPYISFGEGSSSSFGLMARAESGGFQGRALLRYDQADRVVKTYLGRSELSESILAASSFIRGRWFVTPSSPASNLVLYVESAAGTVTDGSGAKFRRLEASEYSYSAATGLISLGKAVETRLAASYAELSTPDITIGGVAYALLFDPEDRGAGTEVLSRYAAAGAVDQVFVRDRASGKADEDYEVRFDPAGFVEVRRGSPPSPSDPDFRQPFLSDMPELYTRDFEAETAAFAPLLTKEIVLRRLGSASEILVDKNLVLGSVEVLRNGVPDYAFSLDLEKGILSLANPAGLAEEIEVSYLRESGERRAGSLAAGLAGIYSLGESASAWAALGGRLGLPGTSYAEGGKSNPGSLVLSAGMNEEGGKLKTRLALAGSLTTEESSGSYRVEGMEASGSYDSSFSPLSDPGTFEISERLDSRLGEDFPRLALELHRDGSVQQALKILAPAGGDIELSKILDPLPLEKLKTFTFLARKVGTFNAGGKLEISLDDGAGNASLHIELPGDGTDIGLAWSRYYFRYGEGEALLFRQTAEGGDLVQVPLASVSYNAFENSPARLLVSATGLSGGAELWLDELILEDSRGRAALQAEGLLSYSDPALRLGEAELPFLSGLELSFDASAALQSSPYATGGLSLGTKLGPLGLEARLRGRAGSEGGSLRAGHGLLLPASPFPLALSDGFDYDPESGGFGRESGLKISAAGLGFNLDQSSAWTPAASLVGQGLLLQEWKAGFQASPVFSAELSARQASRPGALALDPGYAGAWLSAFAYLLPRAESSAESRSLGASLGFGALEAGTIGRVSLSVKGEPGSPGLRRNELLLRLAAPLALARGLRLEPYYQRLWTEGRGGAGSGLLDLAGLAAKDLGASPAFASPPFAELFSVAAAEDFAVRSAGLAEAYYKPELGLSLARPYGSLWTDLLVPSGFSFAYRRELGRELEGGSLLDAQVFEGRTSHAALNLFGSLGSLPLSSAFATDDYLFSFQASLSLPAAGGKASWSLLAQQLAGFYASASGQGGRLSLENRLSLNSGPAESGWSELLKLELVIGEERHWLLDLFRLVIAEKAEASPEGGSRLGSSYLKSIASASPRARTLLGFTGTVTGKRSDAEGSVLDFGFEESYEARLSIPERLSASAKAALTQSREGESGLLLLGFSLGLSLNLSF